MLFSFLRAVPGGRLRLPFPLLGIICLTAASGAYCFPRSDRQDTLRIYVAPDGNDDHSGTMKSPLESFEGARKAVRRLLKEQPGNPVTVYFRGGTYLLDKPVALGKEDSGTPGSPVIYRHMNGEIPVFTGSKSLSGWKKLRDKTMLSRLDKSVHGKVWVTDLRRHGISDYGDPTDLGARPELFCDGKLQTLARWPDTGFVKTEAVKGSTPLPPNYSNTPGTKEGIAIYTDSYQDRWAAEKDVRLGGYWFWDWSEQFHKVSRWDPAARTFYIQPPYHGYGYKAGARYFGLNLFCEIDQPGEWYLDRETGLLYWYPPEGVAPSRAEVRFTTFPAEYMVEIRDCSHIRLMGLTFREGRGSAILVKDGENCLISDCRIQRFGRDGIHISDGRNHGISGSLMEHFGCGGIRIKGGDRRNLVSSGHFIENTIVEHFSVFKRTYEPAVHLDGCGHRVSNSRFRFSSSSAFRVEGNDFLIEYNQVSRVVNESDDQGGIDIFYNPSYQGIVIRYNHWSDIRGGTKHGAAGVRLDDMISGVHIYGNIFEKTGAKEFGGVQIHGGKDNLVENNLFYKCFAAVSFSTWGEKRWLEQLDSPEIRKRLYEDVDIGSAVYRERYPLLGKLKEKPDVNKVIRNVIVDCETAFLRDRGIQVMEDNKIVDGQGKPLSSFLTEGFFSGLGITPIPAKLIGPRGNRWSQ